MQKISKPNFQNRWVEIDGERVKVRLTVREMRTLDKKGIFIK